MLALRDVEAAYGDALALRSVSIDVGEGETVGILGANGAGKSTLLKVIAGHLRPKAGQVELDGQDIAGRPPYEVAERGVGLVPEGRRVFFDLTVQENLLVGASTKSSKARRAETYDQMMEMFPRLAERRNQQAGTMSGGEQQMLAIARALMTNPRLLLMDEPSLGLAPLVTELVFEKIQLISKTGVAILLVEQNASLALDACSRGYVLEQGTIVVHGDQETLRESPAVRSAYLGIGSE